MDKKLKIGYFADGPWSHIAFEKLVSDKSLDIKFIVPRFDTKDTTLFDYAQKYDIDYFSHKDINSNEFLQKIRVYGCDILVSMSFNQIFKSSIINLTPNKIINCHAGKLPFYRGRNILNWVLINDEKEFGITVHFVDDGIDTGDIILQRVFPISDDDNYFTLLNKSYVECAIILYDAIKLFQRQDVHPIVQNTIHPIGFYCGIRGEGDEIINWGLPAREIFNFVRAICLPGPMAQSTINNRIIKINKINIVENAPNYKGTNGQIIGKTNNSFYVKTNDSFIEVIEFNYEGSIRIGDRLK